MKQHFIFGMQEGTPLAFLNQQTASLWRCSYVKNQKLVRNVSSKLTWGSKEPQVSCFQAYCFSLWQNTYIAYFKKMKSCLTKAMLFPSGRRELFQSTPLRTNSVLLLYGKMETSLTLCKYKVSLNFLLFSPGAYVVNESPVRLSGCKGATYITVLRGHQGT